MLALTRIWILLSAGLVSAGWVLSLLHQLNRLGYALTFALAGLAWLVCRPKSSGASIASFSTALHKIQHRFHRPLPLLFLAVALASLASGVLYAPGSGDSNAYRIPRVFHWLGQEQWHWIHTLDIRMNIAGTGFEWLCAPLALFTGYDRGFFLINWISYLLLPGLVYSLFTRLGVRGSVAWWWMWLVPTGWCYAWQAQSTINDSFAVIYALASVDFALRARQSGRLGDWWLAVLAAALLTGAKQTCIPLVLVSLVALWPGLRPMFGRPWATLLILATALLVSCVPGSILNMLHTGNWMGLTHQAFGWANASLDSPFWGILGNLFCLTIQNLKPPIFPLDQTWNAAMQHFVQTPFGSHFKSFEMFGMLDQSATESSSGIGLFLCALILLSVMLARRLSTTRPSIPAAMPVDGLVRLLWLTPWIALLIFMAKVGSYENARQLAPYYVFFFPVLLAAPGHALLVRQPWWRRLGCLLSLATLLIVMTSRGGPLFPAETLFGWLHEKHPQSKPIEHLLASFSSREAVRLQRLAFHSDLPPEEKVVGYYSVTWCAAEPGFWQPFGIRRVDRVLPGDTLAWVRSRNIHYVVVDSQALDVTKHSLAEWLREYDAELVAHVEYGTRWGAPPQQLYLARLRPAAPN